MTKWCGKTEKSAVSASSACYRSLKCRIQCNARRRALHTEAVLNHRIYKIKGLGKVLQKPLTNDHLWQYEYLGKSLVYEETQEIEEEIKCLEICIRKYSMHPLFKMIVEQIIMRTNNAYIKPLLIHAYLLTTLLF